MNPHLISVAAALLGAVIGGLASALTSWLAERVRSNGEWWRQEHRRREQLYDAFIENAVESYADALQHDEPDVAALVALYAKIDRMYLHSSRAVIESAEEVRRKIVDTFLDDNKAFPELREMLAEGSIDLFGKFSAACRVELDAVRAGRG